MRTENRTPAFEWYHFSMILNDVTQMSRSYHYLTLNISETVRDTDVVIMEYL